jgi:hypothetical protein
MIKFYLCLVPRWEFETIDFDIGFAVLFESGEEVLMQARINSHISKEEGHVVCENPGKCT